MNVFAGKRRISRLGRLRHPWILQTQCGTRYRKSDVAYHSPRLYRGVSRRPWILQGSSWIPRPLQQQMGALAQAFNIGCVCVGALNYRVHELFL